MGFDTKDTYPVYSIAVNCKGMPVARAKEGREDYVTFTVDRAAIDSFRQKFHALDDADDFTIEPD